MKKPLDLTDGPPAGWRGGVGACWMLLLALSLAGCATGEVADGPAETAPTPASQATGSASDTTAPTPAPASTPTPAVGDGEIRVAGLPFKDADTIVAEMWPGSVVEGGSVKRGTLRRVDKSDLNVPFEFNSAELTAEARAQLDELAQAIRMGPETWAFEVAGHTDAVGEQRYNRRLSILRARAAVDYLHDQHGIDPSRLEPVGYGEERLLDGLKPDSGVNRRVEVRPQEA